jgi:hypothetical protein
MEKALPQVVPSVTPDLKEGFYSMNYEKEELLL